MYRCTLNLVFSTHVGYMYNVYTVYVKYACECYDYSSRDQGEEGNELIVHGVYGMVRHPMYTGVLILLWSQPSMVHDTCKFMYMYIIHVHVHY